jgi:hypothetical protein
VRVVPPSYLGRISTQPMSASVIASVYGNLLSAGSGSAAAVAHCHLVALSLSIPAAAIAVIIPWRRVPRRTKFSATRRRFLFSDGARMVLAPAELREVRGHRCSIADFRSALSSVYHPRRVLARARLGGAMPPPTCSGRLGGAAAAGRTMVMSPAAPDSFAVIFRFGARRWSSGDRSDRRCGRCGATGSTAPTAPIESALTL